MTVITPNQRQLIFTSDSQLRSRRQRISRLRFLKHSFGLVSEKRVFLLMLGVSLISFVGFCFMAIDSVLLSFRIQHLSQILENNKLVKEKLELRQAALFSPESLQNYAKVIELGRPVSISYLVQENAGLISAAQ
ncbi:MAG: hypothetical protein AB1721_01265 [Patescibacteria group bacterium]